MRFRTRFPVLKIKIGSELKIEKYDRNPVRKPVFRLVSGRKTDQIH